MSLSLTAIGKSGVAILAIAVVVAIVGYTSTTLPELLNFAYWAVGAIVVISLGVALLIHGPRFLR